MNRDSYKIKKNNKQNQPILVLKLTNQYAYMNLHNCEKQIHIKSKNKVNNKTHIEQFANECVKIMKERNLLNSFVFNKNGKKYHGKVKLFHETIRGNINE